MYAGFNDEQMIQSMFEKCDVIFVTNFVFDKFNEKYHTDVTITRADIDIDPENLEFIISKITD